MIPTPSPTLPLSADEAMRLALSLARAASTTAPPNPAVGCVILAADGRIVGTGQTQRAGGPHAEIMALRDAAARGVSTTGATAFVTLAIGS